jgi:hypothetical protein
MRTLVRILLLLIIASTITDAVAAANEFASQRAVEIVGGFSDYNNRLNG